MKEILVFAGTTEGRRLAELLAGAGIPAVVCVATEYGRQIMPELPTVTIHEGRMDEVGMLEFMRQGSFLAVVDATHPFAVEVSGNIRKSAAALRLPYLRLRRDTAPWRGNVWNETAQECYFHSHEECAAALMRTEGNILLTTGSRDLKVYCEHMCERLYVRVLPSEESIGACRREGLAGGQILAMQGPFTVELNAALIRQYDIKYLVTKESGAAGGFGQKREAAELAGASLYVIGNPERQEGLSFAEVCGSLEQMTGVSFAEQIRLQISLVGVGMGGRGTLTVEAEEKIRRADYLFGAKRLLIDMEAWTGFKSRSQGQVSCHPYYMAEDIIPVLEEIALMRSGQTYGGEAVQIAVLFSGDSGFYSGCQSLYRSLLEWKAGRTEHISVRVYAGVCAVSYLAAACGISWQDAKLMSIHGRSGEEWEPELLGAVRCHEKVFLLVSGAGDVRKVGRVMREAGFEHCRILLGHQLSYEEESIRELSPAECEGTEGDGLYILAILNGAWGKRRLAPQRADHEFCRIEGSDVPYIRGIPMTKEEIRQTAVCKLRLWEGAVVYDIGSGTGSVAVEIAGCAENVRVFAIEQREEGVELIRQNQRKFQLPNIKAVHGTAPEAFVDLPAPTHAFIGGSGGRLGEILGALCQKNSAMRVVITAVSLETLSEITGILDRMSVTAEEIIQLQVSRARRAGAYRLMQAENPVYICSFTFAGGLDGHE